MPADVVEATWRRVAGLERADVLRIQSKHGPLQPELTGFVLAFTSTLRPDALGLALYLTFVVYEMFRAHCRHIVKARERTVLRQWAAARALVDDLQQSGARPVDLLVNDLPTTEPSALRYVIEALTERTEDDPIEMNEDEFWQTVAVLKTVVETLHEMAQTDLD